MVIIMARPFLPALSVSTLQRLILVPEQLLLMDLNSMSLWDWKSSSATQEKVFCTICLGQLQDRERSLGFYHTSNTTPRVSTVVWQMRVLCKMEWSVTIMSKCAESPSMTTNHQVHSEGVLWKLLHLSSIRRMKWQRRRDKSISMMRPITRWCNSKLRKTLPMDMQYHLSLERDTTSTGSLALTSLTLEQIDLKSGLPQIFRLCLSLTTLKSEKRSILPRQKDWSSKKQI